VSEFDTWVFEMTQEQLRGLSGSIGRLFRESLVSALHFQLTRADEILARLGGVTNPTLLAQASGNLKAFITEESET
jgi:hypothetical protein